MTRNKYRYRIIVSWNEHEAMAIGYTSDDDHLKWTVNKEIERILKDLAFLRNKHDRDRPDP